jgi:hypothetical protein
MDINFSALKFDKTLLTNLQNINPYEIFEKLGLSKEDTDKILQGDYEPVTKEEPFIIDYNTFLSNYGKYFNDNLIKYLFQLAFEEKELSNEEYETYKEAIDSFFELVFKIGIAGTFKIDFSEESDEECLLIQLEGSFYILIKTPELNKIFYLEKTSTS